MNTDQVDFKRLSFEKEFRIVQKELHKKSKIRLSEFIPFIKLYQIPETIEQDITDGERKELTDRFLEKINLYSETNIVDDLTGEVLFTLPRVFKTVESIAFDEAINKPLGAMLKPHALPKHLAEATEKIVKLLIASQAKDKKAYSYSIYEEQKRFKELSSKIKELQKEGAISFNEESSTKNIIKDEFVEEENNSYGSFSEE